MLEEILSKISFISPIFYQVLYMTVVGSIVGLLIYFVRNIFDKKISGKWKCIMWCIALVTLLIPIRIEIKTDKSVVMQSEIIDSFENIKYINQESSRVTKPSKEEKTGVLDFSDFNDETSSKKSFENMNQVVNADNNMTSIQIAEEQKLNTDIKELILNILIPSVWMFGILIFITTFISGSRRINKRISKNIYKDERLENILSMCKKQLVIKKKINIVLQSYKKVPSIFGILNPSILITEETLEQDNQTIKYIFLHELSHYKRKDLIFNYVLLCVLSIHWFNPVVWFLFKKIRQDIEIGADELASKKLDKNEKKEYGMVLINLLKNRTGENYTASMLCMSDTGKNMERRIHMIKGKSSSVISIILVIIVALVVIGFIFIKFTNNSDIFSSMEPLENTVATQELANTEENTLKSFETMNRIEDSNIISNESDNIAITQPTDKERVEIEEYVNKICNKNDRELTEFDNINNADKDWICSHLEPRVKTDTYSYSTKEQIEEDLMNLFGPELIFDVEKNIKLDSDAFWPYYNNEDGNYSFPHYGYDMNTYYINNGIKKSDDNYIVNLIEYFETSDLFEEFSDNMGNYTVVYNYQTKNNLDNHTGIFHIQTSKIDVTERYVPSKIISAEVLKRKEQFRSFDIILKRDDNGKLCITESKIVSN